MQIEFQATKDDYRKFLISYFFKRTLVIRSGLIIGLSLYIGSFKQSDQPFIVSFFLLKTVIIALILFVLIVLAPYIIAKINFKIKSRKINLTEHKTIETTSDGIIISAENENTFLNWEIIRNVGFNNGYLFVSSFTTNFYLIPSKAFLNDRDVNIFIAEIKSNIQKVRVGNKYRKIRKLYYWGLIGFIPNFGVISGIILIVKGIQFKKTIIILIGLGSILFTILFWKVFYPLIEPNGFKEISQMQLNALMKNVEFYKLQNGQYPDSLKQLLIDDKYATINDAIQLDKRRNNTYYNYENLGDKYLLFSSGQDGIPNTTDDFYPIFSPNDSSKIGFIRSK